MRRAAGAFVVLLVAAVALAQGLPPPGGQTGSSGGGSSDAGTLTPAQVLEIVYDAGALTASNLDVYGNTFIANATSNTDGGVRRYSFISNRDSCIGIGAATGVTEICADGLELDFFSTVNLQTVSMVQPLCQGRNCDWYTDPGYWFGPRAATNFTGCVSGAAGGLKMSSTDGQYYFCDGSAVQKFASVIGPAVYVVDFPSIPSGSVGTTDVTVTGARVGDGVIVNPCGTLENNLGGLQGRVSATNTVTIRGRNFDGVNALDPAACNYDLTVVRK
jgi:hypothetical protein